MMDERRLYIGQLIRNYKQNDLSPNGYCVSYTIRGDKGEQYRLFGHNEGIEFVIDYIRELEKKIDELQYIEKIIKQAKAEC